MRLRLLAALAALAAAPVSAQSLDAALAARVHALYAQRDASALRTACASAAGDNALLCRYRLYPLTQDASLLRNAPAPSSAAGHALAAGLLGYEAARAPMTRMIALGRRIQRSLDAARRLDPSEPLLLLVDGQGLVFRPAVVGGDKRAALRLFRQLRQRPGPASSAAEADVWTWFTLYRMNGADAEPMRQRLRAASLPPLFRAFVDQPPGG
ncbi:MAG: hypothetical protein IAE99_07305 [Rhodothermales bacterium]|nr:hypothetical protein [Rhodothermales bacterium]